LITHKYVPNFDSSVGVLGACINRLVLPMLFQKRFLPGMPQSVCPTIPRWERITRARNINGTEVDLYQPTDDSADKQWFYTVACAHLRVQGTGHCRDCCSAIDSR